MSRKSELDLARISEQLEDAWLGIDRYGNELFNPLEDIPTYFHDEPQLYILWLLSNPDYFALFCKYILNIELFPFQCVVLNELWIRKFPILIGSRGFSKSFQLALYSILRLCFMPGRKIVITGAGFRQSKIIFEYMEKIWYNAPLLRDLVGNSNTDRNGPSHGNDMWRFVINESQAIAIPVGNGEKIRGQRANDILVDEFAVGDPNVFEHVTSGFALVAQDPLSNVKLLAKQAKAKELKIVLDDALDDSYKANQIILSGTAYYSFNHFYKYWRRNQAIVNSRGDKKRLAEIGIVDDSLDWRDYSVIRCPYDMLPKGYMEEAIVSRSRASMHEALFMMELEACLKSGTKIITDCGLKNIENIQIGDMVLTHNGRFRPVCKLMKRFHHGNIINIKTFGYGESVFITEEHPVLIGDDFIEAKDINDTVELINLKELNGKTEIISNLFTTNYKERRGYIFPASSASKWTNDQVNLVLKSNMSTLELSKIIGCTPTQIYNIKYMGNRPKPKNAIPSTIKLDYDFGIIVGYYASEGSVTKDKCSVSFSLDGHVDTQLEYFITELCSSIKRSLKIDAKISTKKIDNVASVYIHSRVFGDLISSICPGNCYNKMVLPEILYSNEEFLRGFIVGYWNGDGHQSDNRNWVVSSSASCSLSSQVKLALSYFGLSSSFLIKPKGTTIINGKEHKTTEVYLVKLGGSNARKFKNVFYNKNLDSNNNNLSSITNIGDRTQLKLINKTIEKYSDYVYNFEVADDNSYSLLNMTVHNCFSDDSNGFFKRSVIEKCVDDYKVMFEGNPSKQYVIAVDPAAESDNFCIVVLEADKTYRKIVYCWTTTRKLYKEEKKRGIAKEDDFYEYAARKILSLVNKFHTIGIAIDSQGGGNAIIDRLHTKSILQPGEAPLWKFINKEKPTDDDAEDGRHIIEAINFADAEWTSAANHGMKLDLETRALLFPKFDSLVFAELDLSDDRGLSSSDIIEESILEIEELKNELSSIIMTQTPTGRDKWDTPDRKISGAKKGTMRKDRYSALVMGNALAKKLVEDKRGPEYGGIGGFAGGVKKDDNPGVLYTGGRLAKKLNDLYKDF